MANVRTIHVDWYSQRPPRFSGGPQLAYQGDHLSNMVVFDNAPELPNYYLLVRMKTDDEGPVVELPAIMLEGPYWVIPNYYTQICQQITYQVCCKTETGDYEHHSAKFNGTILPVLKHNGEPIDQSSMFDPYIDILDKRVDELIVAAGDIQIDSELKSDSTNPVQNKIVKAAIDDLTDDVDAVNGRLHYKADNVYGGETVSTYLDLIPGSVWNGNSGKIQDNADKRARTIQLLYTPDMLGLSLKNGYVAYVYGNNDGIGSAFSKIDGWAATVNFSKIQYKYIYIVVKRSDEDVITSDDLSEVLTISSYDEVLPYALERDLHTVSESVGSVNARLSDFIGIVDFDLEKGNLNSGDERPVASSYNSGTRGRTPVDNPVNLFGNSIIKVESGYRIYPRYNAGDGLVNEGRWVTGEYVVPADSDVWFTISPTTETSGEVIPIETLKEQITIISGNPNSYEQRMSSIERAVSDGEGYMPEYYINHIAAKVEEINQASRFLNGVCFPFITDIHFKANSKNSKYLLKNILDKTACDFVVAGGDYGITRATAAESREIIGNLIDYASYIGHSRWFAINGNHDFTGTESLTWGETYNAIYRPSERWVTDGNVGGWFCIENPVQKTRIICLNSCCPSSFNSDTVMDGLVRIGYAQAKYLVDKLSDGDGYNIIVVSHIASDEAMSGYTSNMGTVQTILESFVAKSAGSSMASGRTLSYDFTSVTNSLIFHLSGHAHADESNVSNGVLSISTTCDAYYRDDGHGAAVGTITEQAFDVYCIDFDAETITAVRVGRGASRKWSFDGTVLSDATD